MNFKLFALLMMLSIVFAQKDYDKTIKKYYYIELIPTLVKSNRNIQKLHLNYIGKLAKENKLVLAGPFKKGGGILILNVATKEEAIEIIELDETIKAKINTYRLMEWYTEKGLFSLEN
jgi:uncharacterized protein YciI